MEIYDVENLTFYYPNASEPALSDISFKVSEGEFVVICGQTGCGKSTLLRLLKKELEPNGKIKGCINLGKTDARIGFVMQDPAEQIVTDKVWHELAFGLENLNMSQHEMNLRIAEMSAYFGIESWFDKRVNELSGGQQQILNLASVMAMDPDILILDEPTSQLDPVSASAFTETLKKLHSDFSLTVIIAEHRIEELIPACDRVMIMDKGTIREYDKPQKAIALTEPDDPLFSAMPAAYRLFRMTDDRIPSDGKVPLTIKDGRELLRRAAGDSRQGNTGTDDRKHAASALKMKNVCFRYRRELPDVLCDFDLEVREGEIFCLLGGNGSGKTTASNVAAGLLKPYSGTIEIFGEKIREYRNQSLYNRCLSVLPQDVRTLFMYNSVHQELDSMGMTEMLYAGYPELMDRLKCLMDRHPYDLSGGEQQLVALAKVLSTQPRLLIMDEPTKGLDASRKEQLADILKVLKKQEITCLVITHDVEFAAGISDRCALCFRGRIVSEGAPGQFFDNNRFYTTAACRMSRGIFSGCPTVEMLAQAVKKGIKA